MSKTETNSAEATTPAECSLESATLAGADSPEIGVTLDEYTHTAHTRYAAFDAPGVVWYDPRDGRERYVLPGEITIADFDDADDRVLSSVDVRPFRPGEAVDGQYMVTHHYEFVETFTRFIDGEFVDAIARLGSCCDSEVFGSIDAAREYCCETIEGYAEAPRKDAVRSRIESP